MRKIFVFLALIVSFQGFALLSPLNQSVREIEAILSSKELGEKLGESESITGIHAYQNSYVVVTENYQMTIEVVYRPPSNVGPQQFHLVFNKPLRLGE